MVEIDRNVYLLGNVAGDKGFRVEIERTSVACREFTAWCQLDPFRASVRHHVGRIQRANIIQGNTCHHASNACCVPGKAHDASKRGDTARSPKGRG
nr:MAG TPA: hypothetical protein [Caudoviricetes sp.]